MYNYGSAARELEYTRSFEKVEATKKAKREAQIAQRIEQLKKKALKTLVVITAILTVIMIREAQIDQLCGAITKNEDAIAELDAMIAEKEMYLSGQLDLNMIEEIAVTRLGMQKPDPAQCVYITIETEDGGEILTEEPESNGGFSAFINKAKILLEYLY